MAGRVLRSSNGKFAGSTKGFGAGRKVSRGFGAAALRRSILKNSERGFGSLTDTHLGRSLDATSTKSWRTKSGYGSPIRKSRLAAVVNGRSSRAAKNLVFIERQITMRHTSPMVPNSVYNPRKGRQARLLKAEAFQEKIIGGKKNRTSNWDKLPLRGKRIYGAW